MTWENLKKKRKRTIKKWTFRPSINQTLTQWQQKYPDQHHPASRIDRSHGKRPDHQISAHDHVQDACHQQLDDLSYVDDLSSVFLPETFFRYRHVRVPDPFVLASLRVEFVQTVDKDFSSVAADVGDPDHGSDGPISSSKHGERKGHDEHTLKEQKGFNNTDYKIRDFTDTKGRFCYESLKILRQ